MDVKQENCIIKTDKLLFGIYQELVKLNKAIKQKPLDKKVQSEINLFSDINKSKQRRKQSGSAK